MVQHALTHSRRDNDFSDGSRSAYSRIRAADAGPLSGTLSRRKLLAGASALGAGTILAGCSSGGSDSDKPVGKNPSGKISLVSWGAAEDHASIKAIVKRYEKAFPHVKVDFSTGDCGPDIGACKRLIAGGTMPDVLIPHNSVIKAEASLKMLEDLTPLIKRDKVDLSQFVPAALSGAKAEDGKFFGLPMGYHIEVLYYNKAMFDKAGLPYPPATGNYTYDQLRDWARKLTLDSSGNNATQPGFDPKKIKQWGFYTWPLSLNGYDPIVLAYGGSVMSLTNPNQCTITSQNTVKAFQFIQDLIWKDHAAVTPQQDQAKAGKYRFAANQVAMLSGAHWMTPIMQDQAPKLAYDVAPLPKGPAGNASIVNVHSWAIYRGSSQKELAWHFIKWAATVGAGPAMGLIPAYKPIMEPDFLKAPNEPAHLREAFVIPASWKRTVSPPEFNVHFTELLGQDGIGPVVENIYYNKKPAAAALQGACGRINKVMHS